MLNARVLIVEDDPAIRGLLSTLLEREAIGFDVANDGQQALERLGEHRYGLVLLDLMLPRVDGYQILEALKLLPERPVIIVMSAFDQITHGKFDPELVSALIKKPFDIHEIAQVVRSILAQITSKSNGTTSATPSPVPPPERVPPRATDN